MELQLTRTFDREFKKLTKGNVKLKKKISKQLGLLLDNPQHPSLKLHKLSGSQYWSISIDRSIRVLILMEGNIIYIYHVGTHDNVYS